MCRCAPAAGRGLRFGSPVQPCHSGEQRTLPCAEALVRVPSLCEMYPTPFLTPGAMSISFHVPTACTAVCSAFFCFTSLFFFVISPSYRWTKEEEIVKKETGLFRKGEEQRQR